ncbi:MAG TPA: DUF480 domain-containing protein [Woeseiaceae bacterium]|nr:DUF480 domain-containing protein [Woeseiaceae bacterium]
MLPDLTAIEARIIGSLIEKSIITPDQYPMTLNALTAACNQKSSREPVMNLNQGEVQRTLRNLEARHLVMADENFRSRVEKYRHRFCNTRYSDLQFSDAELAIVCLLLLRGAQTAGELRARSGRLHAFADNDEVVTALEGLMRRTEPVVVKLPRRAGRRDAEFMHVFAGPVDVEAAEEAAAAAKPAGRATPSVADLAARIETLEAEMARLRALVEGNTPG